VLKNAVRTLRERSEHGAPPSAPCASGGQRANEECARIDECAEKAEAAGVGPRGTIH